ncbi:MAG: RraA family protein [Thalassobaculum sp.]|uniref:RraA family protein n=1 Tax=Alphaproteobacteria TaxID=28211 RepID=UPI0032EE9D80
MDLNSLRRGFADIATSTIANALDDLGVHGVIVGLRAVVPGTKAIGPAVTVREQTAAYGTFPVEDFKVGHMIEAAAPGSVIVVDNGGNPVSTWGGMASRAAQVKGVAGLIVEGGVRDWEEQQQFRFPLFARHVVPTPGKTRIKVEAIGEPVTIEGVLIRPGDLIVADGSGICVLPIEKAETILQLASKFAADDRQAEDEIAKGLSFREALAKFAKI